MKPFIVKTEVKKIEIKKSEPKKQERKHLIKCNVKNEEDLRDPTPVKVYFKSMDSEGVITF